MGRVAEKVLGGWWEVGSASARSGCCRCQLAGGVQVCRFCNAKAAVAAVAAVGTPYSKYLAIYAAGEPLRKNDSSYSDHAVEEKKKKDQASDLSLCQDQAVNSSSNGTITLLTAIVVNSTQTLNSETSSY